MKSEKGESSKPNTRAVGDGDSREFARESVRSRYMQ